MNEPGPVTSEERRAARPVFVSYATADRKEALAICNALERRGITCWISTRDVAPGENYQEAIVHAIRGARAVVLIFSAAANGSDEIKKELSLASRFRVPVMALRIEDVEPSDAFAYELSTRQWIDAFDGSGTALDTLAAQLAQLGGGEPVAAVVDARAAPTTQARWRPKGLLPVAALILLIIAAAAAWLLLHAPSAPPVLRAIEVRLSGFRSLTPGVPAGMPEAMRDEIIAAFNSDGLVTVSTAPSPPPGTAPAYALGGSIRRDGDTIRVIARLANERSGITLWSNSFDFAASNADRVPRRIAVDAGNLVRCGLFGAATYRKPLPDSALADYLQFCHNTNVDFVFGKALFFARKTVAAVPDFSWGWSAVEKSAVLAMRPKSPDPADPLLQEGLRAAAKAIRLDPSNSEALAYQSLLVDPAHLAQREALLQRALKARPLACGCEHHTYGTFLLEVGRVADAAAEFRRSIDVLAFYDTTQYALGASLLQLGKPAEAAAHFDAAVDLDADPLGRAKITIQTAPVTHDYAAAIKALHDPAIARLPFAAPALAGFEALRSGDAQAKARAAAAVGQLPPTAFTISLLGALGADAQALQLASASASANIYGARGWLFGPTMDAARRLPQFPAVAHRLGLIAYWKTTHTRADVCAAKAPPPFCRMI